MECKHCGNKSFYTKMQGYQYYTENGDPDGYNIYSENKSVYCVVCNKKVCSLGEFFEKTSSGGEE